MSFSKIYVIGAGAVGSSYGALLSKNNDVTLVGNKEHMQSITQHGLTMTGDVNEKFSLKTASEITDIQKDSLVIIATKTYDLVPTLTQLKPFLRPDTVVLLLQNGLGNEEVARRIIGGRAEVVRAVISVGAQFFKPGEVTFWKGETFLPRGAVGEKIARLFEYAGLKVKLSENIQLNVWIKLALNCIANPLTAILQVRDSDIITTSLFPVRRGVFNECLNVAKRLGISLPADLGEKIDASLARYENYSSMYQDVTKHKRTEIDFLNGKIVELGRDMGVATPVNETLVSFVKFIEGEQWSSKKTSSK